MAERTCIFEGCNRKHYGRGLCRFHYDQVRNSGGIDRYPITLGPRGLCSVDGCGLRWHSQGFCSTHYARWKAHGDPLYVTPREQWSNHQPPFCWCGNPSLARGLCRQHWREERSPERELPPEIRVCNVCGKPKPIGEFYIRSDGMPDLTCKDDVRRLGSQRRANWTDQQREADQRRQRHYRAANAEWFRQYDQRDKYRRANVPSNLTREFWLAILRFYEWSCAYCGASQDDLELPLEREHVVPISRGGCDTVANVVPACRTCNARKHDSTAEEWEARGGPHLVRRV